MATVSSYVYLMVEADGRAFKIGTSIDPKMRSFQLHNVIDYDRSLQFRFDGRQAAKAERMLHFLFRASRQTREKADGHTEWFDIQCFALVKQFLWTMRDLVGWADWSPIIPQTNASPASGQAVAATQAASRKALEAARKALESAQREEREVRRKIAAAQLEEARIKALTDRGLSAAAVKKPVGRKASRPKSGPVRSVPLSEHIRTMQREGRW